MNNDISEDLILTQIAKYSLSKRQRDKDTALITVGLRAGLLDKKDVFRDLTHEQRQTVIYFLNQFCSDRQLKVTIQ